MNRLFVCAALTLVVLAEANGHDGHSHHSSLAGDIDLPVWRDVAGRGCHEGSFVTDRESELIIHGRLDVFICIEFQRLGETERDLVGEKLEAVRQINNEFIHVAASSGSVGGPAAPGAYLKLIRRSFGAFAPKVKTRTGSQFFYVESNSIPDHQMMVGITAWQQQVAR